MLIWPIRYLIISATVSLAVGWTITAKNVIYKEGSMKCLGIYSSMQIRGEPKMLEDANLRMIQEGK